MAVGICRFKEIQHPGAGPTAGDGGESSRRRLGNDWSGHCSGGAKEHCIEIHQVSTAGCYSETMPHNNTGNVR